MPSASRSDVNDATLRLVFSLESGYPFVFDYFFFFGHVGCESRLSALETAPRATRFLGWCGRRCRWRTGPVSGAGPRGGHDFPISSRRSAYALAFDALVRRSPITQARHSQVAAAPAPRSGRSENAQANPSDPQRELLARGRSRHGSRHGGMCTANCDAMIMHHDANVSARSRRSR